MEQTPTPPSPSRREIKAIGRNLPQCFLNTAKKYGTITKLPGIKPVYLVADPEALHHIYVSNRHNYTRDSFGYRRLSHLLGHGLITNNDDSYPARRKLLNPCFQHRHAPELAAHTVACTQELIERWHQFAEKKQRFDLGRELMVLSFRIINRMLFSDNVSQQQAETLIADLSSATKRLTTRLVFSKWLPGFNYWMFQRKLKRIETHIFAVIERRRQLDNPPADFLTTLIQAEPALSDQEICDEVKTFYLTGFETTGNMMSWLWYRIKQEPQVEHHLLQEAKQVLGGREPNADDLKTLRYSRAAIDEILRLYPVIWTLYRTNLADDHLSGYPIAKGSLLITSSYVVQRLPQFWPEPDRFFPERFLAEKGARPHYTYLPFGGGEHTCIAGSFAAWQGQLVTSMLMREFELDFVKPKQVMSYEITISMRPSKKLWARVKPRAK